MRGCMQNVLIPAATTISICYFTISDGSDVIGSKQVR